MEWTTTFIIVRPISNTEVAVVNESNSMKDSRYWLNYIAEPFDALHLTPLNPKYIGNGCPTYSCHLVSRAKTDYNEDSWRKQIGATAETKELKFIPAAVAAYSKNEPAEKPKMSETEIIQLADGRPRSLTLEQISMMIGQRKTNLKIILSEATKWIDWESAMTLMVKDVHVIGISPDPKWPLTVTLDPKSGKGETMNYHKDMRFVVKI